MIDSMASPVLNLASLTTKLQAAGVTATVVTEEKLTYALTSVFSFYLNKDVGVQSQGATSVAAKLKTSLSQTWTAKANGGCKNLRQ